MRAAQSGAHMRTSFEGEKRGRTRMHSERHVGEVPCFLGKRFDQQTDTFLARVQPDGHLGAFLRKCPWKGRARLERAQEVSRKYRAQEVFAPF